jgi:VWFA-related protein
MSRTRWGVLLVGAMLAVRVVAAQDATDTLTVTTRLVVLDATVLDKAGHIVAQPLGRDDFLIEEDKKQQSIYSFESSEEHAVAMARGDAEKSPMLIFVLDELNYAYNPVHTDVWNTTQQLANETYERNELTNWTKTQPEVLREPTEVLALTHHGYVTVVQPTRDRSLLQEKVKKYDPGLGSPFRDYLEETGGSQGTGAADHTLGKASMQAVWTLALEERGVPGRKLVIWLGVGGPSSELKSAVSQQNLSSWQRHERSITDLLVDARITLDLVGPGLGSAQDDAITSTQQMSGYHFEKDFGFDNYILATGGKLRNGNDIEGEIQTSVNYGSTYYTLSYRPTNHDLEGSFRRIRVTVKGHPEWTVLTKAGYYGMQFGGAKDAEHQLQTDLSVATFDTMPFDSLGATLTRIERMKNTDEARFTFDLDSSDLQWTKDGTTEKSEADLVVSGAALGSAFANDSLASQVATWKLRVPSSAKTSAVTSTVSLTMRVPEKTKRIRFLVRDLTNGRMGSVDLNPVAVADAPEVAPGIPQLQARPLEDPQ